MEYFCRIQVNNAVRGDRSSGKSANVREFDRCQGIVRGGGILMGKTVCCKLGQTAVFISVVVT